ncbi:MAG TPA: glycosyltransferase [Candidatus Mediterraneibacter surreyensis]|nr:glycosyltransferase [Candidatus Mediterraneibacter surreyensis]
MKFAYVILHYNTYEITCKSVDSILKIKDNTSSIIVVDNCSDNKSGELLIDRYKHNDDIDVIINKKNEGFAIGNNIGYYNAKYQKKADFIIVLNNDVIISQKDFEEQITNLYDLDKNNGIIAPRIINSLGQNQNPFRTKKLSSLKKMKMMFGCILYYFCIVSKIFYPIGYKFFHVDSYHTHVTDKISEKGDIVPHGSCIIFTPSYVSKSDFAFVPITFFYGEEDILYDFIKSIKLNTFYSSRINVQHLEKVATKTISDNSRKREKFQTRNKIIGNYKDLIFRIKLKIQEITKRR